MRESGSGAHAIKINYFGKGLNEKMIGVRGLAKSGELDSGARHLKPMLSGKVFRKNIGLSPGEFMEIWFENQPPKIHVRNLNSKMIVQNPGRIMQI